MNFSNDLINDKIEIIAVDELNKNVKYNGENYSEKKKKINKLTKHLPIIILVTTLMNLVLLGIVIFAVIILKSQIIFNKNKMNGSNDFFIEKKISHRHDSNSNSNHVIKNDMVPLDILFDSPLENIEYVDAIVLEFNMQDNVTKEIKHFQHLYHVESAERMINNNNKSLLTIYLSGNHTLQVDENHAELFDSNGNLLHSTMVNTNRIDNKNNSHLRSLISIHSHKLHNNHDLKSQSTYMAGICKFGCGEMGITYPYYYRPFFGYGFPLLGTEPYYQSGYGGNIDTAMNNGYYNPEATTPRPPGIQSSQYTPFSMVGPIHYPYSFGPGEPYYYQNYYYNDLYPFNNTNPTLVDNQNQNIPNSQPPLAKTNQNSSQ